MSRTNKRYKLTGLIAACVFAIITAALCLPAFVANNVCEEDLSVSSSSSFDSNYQSSVDGDGELAGLESGEASQSNNTQPSPPDIIQNDLGQSMMAHEVLVTFNVDTNFDVEAASIEAMGYSIEETLSTKGGDCGHTVLVELPQDQNLNSAIAALKTQAGVKYAEPNYLAELVPCEDEADTAATINDPNANKVWSLDALGAYNTWDIAKVNKSVSVAVIDAGVNVSHEDLASNIVATYNAADSDDFGDNSENHGTHVTGIISARCNNGIGIAGLSYNAGIVAIDASYVDSLGKEHLTTSAIVKSYDYVIENASKYNIKVVNMSLAGQGTTSSSITEQIDRAEELGIITVCAAGNQTTTSTPPYSAWPGDYEKCVSVMNVSGTQSSSGQWSFVRSSSSNYGEGKNICAPGVGIYSTTGLSFGAKYGTKSGTSMASPQVAATASLIFAANPSLTANQCKDILYSTTTQMGDGGYSTNYGWGVLNTLAAVTKAKAGGETHSYTITITREATCAQSGIEHRVCKYCGEESDEEIPKLDHVLGDWQQIKEPTLGNAGLKGQYCTVCNELVNTQDIDALASFERLSGETRYDTMAKIVDKYCEDTTTKYAIVASGEQFPDALSASYAAGILDAPIILTSPSSLSDQAVAEIKNVGATHVVIVGGIGAVSQGVEDSIDSISTVSQITRISGQTRIQTAEEIYKNFVSFVQDDASDTSTKSRVAILANGDGFADALSVSPISYAQSSPIFLTSAASIHQSTLDILTGGDFDEVLIVGGDSVVSNEIEEEIANAGLTVKRLCGQDRYKTSVEIAQYAIEQGILDVENIAFASGGQFPDALSGSTLCGKNKSVLLLTDYNDTDASGNNAPMAKLVSNQRQNILQIYIFGGDAAVSVGVEQLLRGL